MPTRIDIAKKGDGKWVRPAEWLPIDNLVSVGEHKFVGLCAVIDGQVNDLRVRVGSVNYTVDWGDGTIENYGASVYSLNHTYDFSTITSPLTAEGWKQVIVKIYPTNPVDTFAGYVFVDQSARLVDGWLDIKMASSTCTQITVGSTGRVPYLRKFTYVGSHVPMSLNNNFNYSNLEEFDMDLSNVTGLGTTFASAAGAIFKNDDTDITCLATSMASTFQSCNLKTIGNLTLNGNPNQLQQTFYVSTILERIGNISAPYSSQMNSFASGCINLKSVGTINCPLMTSATNAFSNAYTLRSIGTITTGATFANMSSMFTQCLALERIRISNCSGVTNAGNAFLGCYSLMELILTGIKVSFSVYGTSLSRTALVDLFNSLGTPATTQIVTVTGTPGSANLTAADILIATSKNWTVTL